MNTKNQFYFLVSAPGVLAGLTLLIVGIGAAYYVEHLNRDVSRLVDVNVRSERASEELLLSIRDIRFRLHQFLANRDWNTLQSMLARRAETSEMIATVVDGSPAISAPDAAVKAHGRFFDKLHGLVDSQPEQEVNLDARSSTKAAESRRTRHVRSRRSRRRPNAFRSSQNSRILHSF